MMTTIVYCRIKVDEDKKEGRMSFTRKCCPSISPSTELYKLL